MPSFGLDTSFGQGGIDLNPLGAQVQFSSIAGIKALNNGTLLEAGNLATTESDGTVGDVALVRLTSAGGADKSFGVNGLDVLANLPAHAVSAMVVLPDGKVLLGGSRPDANAPAGSTASDFFVLRVNSNGSLDTTFGNGGEVKIGFGGDDLLTHLAVQADGKIVAAGTTRSYATAENPSFAGKLALARLNANGTVDASFGLGGALVTTPGDGNWTTAGLAIQPDGKLLVGGSLTPSLMSIGEITKLTVYRFNSDGSPDQTFNGNGLAQTGYATMNYASANSLALLKDGTIVLGGSSDYGQGLLAWFKTDGSLLSAEQSGGLNGTGLAWITSIVAAPQGGVEVLGHSGNGADYSLEYHATPGAMANRRDLSVSPGYSTGDAFEVQPDGKYVVAALYSTGFISFTTYPILPATNLSVTRFSDPGLAANTATLVVGAVYQAPTGGPVTLSTMVIPVLGPADVGTATVTFREGNVVLGTTTQTKLTPYPPWPSIDLTLPEGQHAITAAFSGNSHWAASSFTFDVTIAKPTVDVTLAVSNASPYAGEPVTLTATVTATAWGKPYTTWGNITFYDGTNVLGGGIVYGNQEVLSVNLPTVGIHMLRAVYSGPPTDTTTEATTTLTVLPAATATPTSIKLAIELPPGAAGSPVILAATVLPASGNIQPKGMVTFYDGVTAIDSAAIGPGGVATLTTTALRPATHLLSASYAGNADFLPSVSTVQRFTVGPALTTTTLGVPAGPIAAGQPVILSANVKALSAGFPIGSVTFVDGSTVLGKAAVDGRGNASLGGTILTVGTHDITAVYSGCSTCLASSSVAASIVVTAGVSKPLTVTQLTGSALMPAFGQTEHLSVQVSAAAGSPRPTGTVNFYDGVNLIGASALNAQGNASMDVELNLGRRHFKAIYLGDASVSGSTSNLFVPLVSQATTTIDLSTSTASTQNGKSTTLVALVRPQFAGAPIGSVTFLDGNTVLGTALVNGNGVATFKPAALGLGEHSITAVYSGCSTFLGSAAAAFEVNVL